MARPKRSAPNHKVKKRSKAIVQFTALQIEGGILSPSVLSKIAQFDAGMQGEADYRIPKGLALRDEIGRYWRIASAQYGAYRVNGRTEDFIKSLFRDVFQFPITEQVVPIVISERAFPITGLLNGGSVPLIIADSTEGLDSLQPKFGDTGKKRTAFGLLQEFLNAEDACLWGIASDGNTIRIARDNSSLTRPAWIEADLRRIFEEELYADFAVLWLLMHATSFSEKTPAESRIEKWREQGREEGARASEKLRLGVEEALKILGDGFIKHQKNQELRQRVLSGEVTAQQYYQELLRLVYRMIFLLTVEERERLHPKSTVKKSRDLYVEGYSMGRVRIRAVRRTAYDRYADLWDGLKITFRGLARGEVRLGLPALGGLFGEDQTPTILNASLENRFLLSAVRCLSWLEEDEGLSKVNWRDMGPEELGSVYESLLELVPQFIDSGNGFRFANVEDSKGNQRKTSGSYYTPDSLVQSLLDSALEPVIEDTIRKNPEGADRALLRLSIIDPACGSGHFLLGAARRLAVHVARIRAQGTPTAEEFEKALRQVISKCIYGVDRNPMALELARTALWLEAVSPDAPLSFLDHHLVCGDGLLGLIDLNVLKDGIPQEAFKALEGDDSRTVKVLSDQNKETLKGIKSGRDADLFTQSFENFKPAVIEEWTKIQEMPDDTLEAVENKKKAFQKYQQTAWNVSSDPIGLAADMYVASFMARKTQADAMKIPTSEHLGKVLSGAKIDEGMVQFVRELARRHRFLHWKLKFPDVFRKGGFEVVLGNPPWEQTELKEREWFAERNPEVALASTAAIRKKLIAELKTKDPVLFAEFKKELSVSDGIATFLAESNVFPLCGRGRVNLYAVFAERIKDILAPNGLAGCVLPTGVVTDDTTKFFFQNLVNQKALVSIYDFENKELFPGVHKSFKFCLLTYGGGVSLSEDIDCVFFAHNISDIKDSRRHFRLNGSDIDLFNPNTKTCPIFKSVVDAELTKYVYRNNPVFIREGDSGGNPWNVWISRMMNGSDDSHLFLPPGKRTGEIPVYESKFFWQYDHRFATVKDSEIVYCSESEKFDQEFCITSQYYVVENDLPSKFKSKISSYSLAYRVISNATNVRTVVSSILPRSGLINSANGIYQVRGSSAALLMANLNSFVLDYICRQAMGGANLHSYILQQLAVLAPNTYKQLTLWDSGAGLLGDWLLGRVIELVYTASDLKSFAEDCGWFGEPFQWDEQRRFELTCELDAAFFHLYFPSDISGGWTGSGFAKIQEFFDRPRDAVAYILDAFPLVAKRDISQFGHYKTKDRILELYDSFLEASRSHKKFESQFVLSPRFGFGSRQGSK